MRFSKWLLPMMMLACVACGSKEAKTQQETDSPVVEIPVFSGDSAALYVEMQVGFGPRVPGTEAHQLCLDYLKSSFEHFGAMVTIQEGQAVLYDGKKMPLKNIVASFNPEAQKRVIICSHWDSRPMADHDPVEANRNKAIDGANDGASGVGVMMELARLFSLQMPSVGVDLICFDLEDWGAPEGEESDHQDTWCLGSQYWAKHPHLPGYKANYGILLDMVGAPNAVFYREQISDYFASGVVDKIVRSAADLGYSKQFLNEQGGAVTDDHLYVNRLAKIPMADIIQFTPQTETGFAHYWHTLDDSMKNISPETLGMVGSVLAKIIYEE